METVKEALENSLILESISKFLTVRSLKACRQVNKKHWLPPFSLELQRRKLRISFNSGDHLEEYMATFDNSLCSKVFCEDFKFCACKYKDSSKHWTLYFENPIVEKFFQFSRITNLYLFISDFRGNFGVFIGIGTLGKILEHVSKSLENLEIYFPPGYSTLEEVFEEEDRRNRFKLEKLQSLTLNTPPYDHKEEEYTFRPNFLRFFLKCALNIFELNLKFKYFNTNFDSYLDHLVHYPPRNLERLEIINEQRYIRMKEKEISKLIQLCKLIRLKRLKIISICSSVLSERLSELFEALAPSLEEVYIRDHPAFKLWAPLEKIKIFELYQWQRISNNLRELLIMLPNLREFHITHIFTDLALLNDRMEYWIPFQEFTKNTSFTHKKLATLRSCVDFKEYSQISGEIVMKSIVQLFPNLTSLVAHFTDEDLKIVLTTLKTLKKLYAVCTNDDVNEGTLTGMTVDILKYFKSSGFLYSTPPAILNSIDPDFLTDCGYQGIRGLKDLEELHITCSYEFSSENALTDAFIFFGARKLPKLRSLSLTKSRITNFSLRIIEKHMKLTKFVVRDCPLISKGRLNQLAVNKKDMTTVDMDNLMHYIPIANEHPK